MKQRGFGAGKWTGIGGKLEADETMLKAAQRELAEEIGLQVPSLIEAGEITFQFANQPEWDFYGHVYRVESWRGGPRDSAEIRPAWFDANALPFEAMWPDAPLWMSPFLLEKPFTARFVYQDAEKLAEWHLDLK